MKQYEVAQIIENGGATLSKDGQQVQFLRGYQVSKQDVYTLTVENIQAVTKAINKLLKTVDASECVGVWVDGGSVYIDISEKIDRLSDAMNAGIQRKQYSIYDWTMRRCIATR